MNRLTCTDAELAGLAAYLGTNRMPPWEHGGRLIDAIQTKARANDAKAAAKRRRAITDELMKPRHAPTEA